LQGQRQHGGLIEAARILEDAQGLPPKVDSAKTLSRR
jgi:hypothetical protein